MKLLNHMLIVCIMGFSIIQARFVVNEGETPVSRAIKEGISVEKINQLLEKNPEFLDARDIQLRTPLHWAAILGRGKVVESLVARGAQINAQDFQGNTPLHFAAMFDVDPLNREKIISFLVKHGSNIYLRNDYGYSSIDVANPFQFRKLILDLSREVGVA